MSLEHIKELFNNKYDELCNIINEDEKARILNLHENATKKQYLVLEDDMEMSGPPNLEDKKRFKKSETKKQEDKSK